MLAFTSGCRQVIGFNTIKNRQHPQKIRLSLLIAHMPENIAISKNKFWGGFQ